MSIMIHIKFIREGVGLKQGELAEKIGVSRQTLISIESGESTPKLDTALKLVAAIREAYLRLPPPIPISHIDAMVREFLASPFGFTSFAPGDDDPGGGGGQKRGPGRPPKDSAGGLSKVSKTTPSSQAVARKKEFSSENDSDLHSGRKGSVSGPENNGGSEGQTERLPDAVMVRLRQEGEEVHEGHFTGTDLHSATIYQRDTAADECVASEQCVSQRTFGGSEIENVHVSGTIWPRLKTNAARTAFKTAIQKRGWGQGLSTRSIERKLANVSNHRHRPNRKCDAEIAERKDRLADYLLSKVAPVECVGIAGFGDHFTKTTWSSQRPTLEGILRSEKERAQIEAIYGSVPSLATIDRLFRERKGVASKLEVASDHLHMSIKETIGFRAEHAGEIMMADATRLPVNIEGAWGKRRKRGEIAHWLHAICCPESLYCLLYVHAQRSETAAWDDCLTEFYFRLGYRPRLLITDENAKLAHDIFKQRAGEPCTLGPGLRLFIASGTQVFAHTPQQPTAKGAIEAGVMKSGKARLKSLLVARACEQEIPLNEYRKITGDAAQHEWNQLCLEWEKMMHERKLRNTGFTRSEGWNDDAETGSASWRAENAHANRKDWRTITDAFKIGSVIGNTIRVRRPGEKTATAEIVGLDRVPARVDGCDAIIAPSGLMPNDDPDMSRVIILDKSGKGQPKSYAVEAKAIRTTFWGRLENKPLHGAHPIRKIQTREEALQAEWHRNNERVLKQGTTDEPVTSDDSLSNFV